MSRATARAAVLAFFQAPTVAGLNRVFSGPKRREAVTWASDYLNGVAATSSSGAIAVIEIPHSREHRRAVGGAHSGEKQLTHELEVHIFFRSTRSDLAIAVDDLDVVIDAFKSRLRSDRTLNSGNVWQAGEEYIEDEEQDRDITTEAIEIQHVVRFDVSEFLVT